MTRHGGSRLRGVRELHAACALGAALWRSPQSEVLDVSLPLEQAQHEARRRLEEHILENNDAGPVAAALALALIAAPGAAPALLRVLVVQHQRPPVHFEPVQRLERVSRLPGGAVLDDAATARSAVRGLPKVKIHDMPLLLEEAHQIARGGLEEHVAEEEAARTASSALAAALVALGGRDRAASLAAALARSARVLQRHMDGAAIDIGAVKAFDCILCVPRAGELDGPDAFGAPLRVFPQVELHDAPELFEEAHEEAGAGLEEHILKEHPVRATAALVGAFAAFGVACVAALATVADPIRVLQLHKHRPAVHLDV